jgi:hypothetical protein
VLLPRGVCQHQRCRNHNDARIVCEQSARVRQNVAGGATAAGASTSRLHVKSRPRDAAGRSVRCDGLVGAGGGGIEVWEGLPN